MSFFIQVIASHRKFLISSFVFTFLIAFFSIASAQDTGIAQPSIFSTPSQTGASTADPSPAEITTPSPIMNAAGSPNTESTGGTSGPNPGTTGGINAPNPGTTGGTPPPTGSLINPLKVDNLVKFIEQIIDVILIFAVPIIVLFIMYAGFLYVTAAGNPGKIEHANSALLYAVIGGVIVLGANLIIKVIQGTIDGF